MSPTISPSISLIILVEYSSAISGLERVADYLVNVGYSIINPIGSQKEN